MSAKKYSIEKVLNELNDKSIVFEGFPVFICAYKDFDQLSFNNNALKFFGSSQECVDSFANIIKPVVLRAGHPKSVRIEKIQLPQNYLSSFTLTVVSDPDKKALCFIINDQKAFNAKAYIQNDTNTWHQAPLNDEAPQTMPTFVSQETVADVHIDEIQNDEIIDMQPNAQPEEIQADAHEPEDAQDLDQEHVAEVEIEQPQEEEAIAANEQPWWIQGEYSEDTISMDVDHIEEEVAEPVLFDDENQPQLDFDAEHSSEDQAENIEVQTLNSNEEYLEPLNETIEGDEPLEESSLLAETIENAGDENPILEIPEDELNISKEEEISEPSAPAPELFQLDRPIRFLWESDAQNILNAVSPELALVVGTQNAAIVGSTWQNILLKFNLDQKGLLERSLRKKETWSGQTVFWPSQSGMPVEIELAAIAMFDSKRQFKGYRGFGVIKPFQAIAQAEVLPIAVNGTLDHILEEQFQEENIELSDVIEQNAPVTLTPAQEEQPKKKTSTKTKKQTEVEPTQIDTIEPINTTDTALGEKVVPLKRKKGNGARLVALHDDVSIKRAQQNETLNPPEQNAFEKIAQALGARLHDEAEQKPQPKKPKKAKAQSKIIFDDTHADVLNQVDVPIAISQMGQVVFANQALLSAFQLEMTEDIIINGGLEKLIQNDDNLKVSLKAISWNNAPASLWTIQVTKTHHEKAQDILQALDRQNAPTQTKNVSHSTSDEMWETRDKLTKDALLKIDTNDKIIEFNLHAPTLLGTDANDLRDMQIYKVFHPKERKSLKNRFADLRQNFPNDLPQKCIIETHEQGKEVRTLELNMVSTSAQDIMLLIRDITHFTALAQDSKKAQELAEKENVQKSDYLARIAHEVRTPINAIIGFADLMREERFGPIENDRYKDYLDDIKTSGEHVISLVNDLLDLAKINAGQKVLDFKETNVQEIIEECVSLISPVAQKKQIFFRNNFQAIPIIVADHRSLKQICLNILSNSIKFTSEGGQIIISTALEDTGEVALRFRDTGCGMSEKEIQSALKPFTQINPDDKNIGTGLGLPLIKALTHANRAFFNIESKKGEGTLIEIIFPPNRVLAS